MVSGKGYRTIKISKVWTDGVAGIRYQFAIRMRNKLPRWTNYFHKKTLYIRLHARTLCHYTCTNNSENMYSSRLSTVQLARISISMKPLYPHQIQIITTCMSIIGESRFINISQVINLYTERGIRYIPNLSSILCCIVILYIGILSQGFKFRCVFANL